jgi:hypothetical protein
MPPFHIGWQRDWARKDTYDATITIVQEHSGACGMGVKHGERIGPKPAK